ncbi:MAG: SBBP repeat-containing protein [candidate division WOR-3 bacterium]
MKYDSNGNLLWVRRYNGPADGFDWATSLFVDNNGNVYVTGYSYGLGTNFDYATIKYIQEAPNISEGKGNKNEKKMAKNKIYDISGKLVKENKLKKGIYFKETEKGREKVLILKY